MNSFHRVIGNGVTIAEYEKVLHIPRNFSKLGVLSQDGTTAEEMSHLMAHITLSACCSWPGSILPLVVILPSWYILKGLGPSTRIHLCSHGHLKVLPHHSDGIQDLGDFCLYWWSRHGGFGRSQRSRAFVPVIEA